MKIKCVVCQKEVVLTKEDVQKLIGLSKTGKVRPERILKLENIYEGECDDGEEHTFSWDIEFLKEVEGLKGKHKELLRRNDINNKYLGELETELDRLRKEIESNENKKKDTIIQIEKDGVEIPVIEEGFEKITGTKDLGEWS